MATVEDAARASGTDHLLRTVLLGLLRLQVILALVIFLPSGSLHYWQGWLFWLVFFACVLVVTLYFVKHDPHLIENRMKAGPGAEQQRSQKIIQAFTGTLAAALVIVSGLDHRYGWSSVPTPIVLLGDALVVLGFAIVYQVFKENSFAASTIKVEAEQRVISTGPYAIVRHPMYVGGALMLLATPLALGSFVALPIGVALTAAIVVRLLDEERYLTTNLTGYDAYCREVKYRMLPIVW
jgi:protein-S-isoprenylcysteine O-methyltransferase Ste14